MAYTVRPLIDAVLECVQAVSTWFVSLVSVRIARFQQMIQEMGAEENGTNAIGFTADFGEESEYDE